MQLEELKRALRQKRSELVARLQNHRDVEAEWSADDHVERASDSDLRNTNVQDRTVIANSLTAVEVALKKLDRGTYGLCESCGKEIGGARLQAFPTATHCFSCAQKISRKGRSSFPGFMH